MISRRGLLALTGVGAVAAALEVRGLLDKTFTPALADEVTDAPGRGLFGGLTTMDQTVLKDVPNDLGYARLVASDGEAHVVRNDLAFFRHPTRALGAFVQITDMQICDDQSPARVEFTDRYANLPNSDGYDTDSAYRPQEMLSTHIAEAMVRAIRHAGVAPMTGLPFAFTIATGDMVDNVQYNEVRWYIDLLDGQQIIRADSGQIGVEQSVSYRIGGVGRTGFHDLAYWYPEAAVSEGNPFSDDYQRFAGLPVVPGLLAAARRPYTSTGLGMPWYAAMGNHDGEIQGNYPVHPSEILGTDFHVFFRGLPDISDLATGGNKAIGSGVRLEAHPDGSVDKVNNLHDVLDSLFFTAVAADHKRVLLARGKELVGVPVRQDAFASEHFNTAGTPVGHGFVNVDNTLYRTYYTIPSGAEELIQYITLDTVCYDGGANGRVPADQYNWLESQLRANSSQYIDTHGNTVIQHGVKDKLFVLFAHHTIATINNGDTDIVDVGDVDFHYSRGVENLLLRYPNVILMVAGHTHRNVIVPHLRGSQTVHGNTVPGTGGFWEISTASHIDWPSQSRILELAVGAGVISIFTTMLDIAAPLSYGGDLSSPVTLAALARELAANDPTERPLGRRGGATAVHRNTQLLVPVPFTIDAPDNWGSSLALGLDGSNRLDLWGTNPSDLIFHRSQPTAGSDTWAGWTQFSGQLRTVAIGTNLDGRLEVVGVNAAGVVFHNYQLAVGGWSGWTVIGSTTTDPRAITVGRNADGRLQVFVATAHWDVWHASQTAANAGTWTDWTPGFGLSGLPMVRLAAETDTDGRLDLFGVTLFGEVWHRTRATTGTWTNWTSLGTRTLFQAVAIAATRNADGRLQLYIVDNDRRIYLSSQASPGSDTWTSWTQFDGGRTRMTQVTAQRDRNGTIQVFGVDHVGHIWNRRQTAPNATSYTAWIQVGGTLRPDIPVPVAAAVTPAPVTMPNVIGESEDAATRLLTGLGLVVGPSSKVFDCTDPGSVANQNPAPGTVVARGSTVTLGVHQATKADGKPCTVDR